MQKERRKVFSAGGSKMPGEGSGKVRWGTYSRSGRQRPNSTSLKSWLLSEAHSQNERRKTLSRKRIEDA